MSAQVAITQLPAAGAITGTEAVPIVQNGVTVQTTTAAISASPSQPYTYLTAIQTPQLPNSRYVGVTNGLEITDGGSAGLFNIGTTGALLSLVNSSAGFQVKTSSTAITNRSIAVTGSGLSITNGDGIAGNPTVALAGQVLSLANLSANGLMTITTGGVLNATSLVGTANQIGVANPTGIGGSPTISIVDNATLPGTGGVVVPKGTTAQQPVGVSGQFRFNTTTNRFEGYISGSWVNIGSGDGTVTNVNGTTNQIAVLNGTTTPIISISPNPIIPGTASITMPIGATGQRPTGVNGMFRYNTDLALFEGFINGSWQVIAAGTGVTSVATGTGLTGGPITSTGTISIAATGVTAGSYGSTSQVPSYTVNAQGQLTSASNITISPTDIGAVTSVSGTSGEITSSGGQTPVLSLPSALTFTGKTITGGTYNMTAAAVASDIVTTNTAAQTLTNKTISGSSNTLTNIANASLTNSSVTVGSTNIALGATAPALAGLTSVTVTQDPTLNLQLATKQYVDTIAATGIHYHTPVYVESPNTVGNLTATYASGGTSTTITTIANGTDVTFASGVPTVGSQVSTATGNGLVSGTQYWVVVIVGGAVQLSLTYGGAPITGLTNGTGLSIASVINAGVGATLTNAGTQAALTIDGVLTTVGMRVLIYNQTNQIQNGVYTVTVVGTVSTNWVLTRATDADTYSPNSENALGNGDAFFVQAGNTGAGEVYDVSTTGSIFFGQTNITFVQISSALVYVGASPINITGTTISLTTVPATLGGTGQSSYTAGDLLYATDSTTLTKLPIGVSGRVLKSTGTAPAWQLNPTYLPVVLHNATSVQISVASGYLPVLLHNGVTTVNVALF
jgi:trimeric autotransporter adhesin